MTERLQVDLRPPWISLAGVAAATLGLAGIARLMVGNGPSWWRPVSTVAMAVFLQAFPFVVLGVAISAALTTLVPAGRLARLLPRSVWASVPMAAAAGAVLPGCECGSVPAARRLMQGGIAPGAALAFALAAPAINPVVLVATAVAFPANPEMVVGRALGASLAAIAVGWAWTRVGSGIDMPAVNVDASLAAPPMRRRFELLRDAILEDLALASGYLVIGAILVAVSQRALPPDFIDSLWIRGGRRHGRGGGSAFDLFRGRRVHRGWAGASAASGPARISDGGANGRPQTDRTARRHIWTKLRSPFHSADIGCRHRGRGVRIVGCPMSAHAHDRSAAGLIRGVIAAGVGLLVLRLAFGPVGQRRRPPMVMARTAITLMTITHITATGPRDSFWSHSPSWPLARPPHWVPTWWRLPDAPRSRRPSVRHAAGAHRRRGSPGLAFRSRSSSPKLIRRHPCNQSRLRRLARLCPER